MLLMHHCQGNPLHNQLRTQESAEPPAPVCRYILDTAIVECRGLLDLSVYGGIWLPWPMGELGRIGRLPSPIALVTAK